MKYATIADLKDIYGHFLNRKDVFAHARQDKLRRMIEAGQVIWQDGVIITFQLYRRAGKIAATCRVRAKAGDVILHQILNSNQFSGAGRRVFREFVDEIVKPSGGDLYLSVRTQNAVACRFYERQGMRVTGTVAWSGGTIPGLIYKFPKARLNNTDPVSFSAER